MSIDVDTYCSNPGAYSSSLTKDQIDYYNRICQAKQTINTNTSVTGNKWGDLPFNILEGIFTPEGIKLISIFYGIDIAPEMLGRAFYSGILSLSDTALYAQASAEAAEKGGIFATSAMLSTLMTKAAEDSALAATALAVGKVAGYFIDRISGIFIFLSLAMLAFDTWDPCHFNDMLDGPTLKLLSDQINDGFRKQIMSQNSFTDNDGVTYFINNWPIEYYADNIISSDKQDVYQSLMFNYIVQYLDALKYNSNGQLIIWPLGGGVPNPSDLQIMATQAFTLVGDNNTVVAKMFQKYWPILLLILIVVIIFFIKIK